VRPWEDATVASWTARVELAHPGQTADELDDVLDAVMTRLADYAPVATVEESTDGSGCVTVILTFGASDLRTAVATALELVETAVEEQAAGIEALPADVYADRLGDHGQVG
jgi:hypothetical protein